MIYAVVEGMNVMCHCWFCSKKADDVKKLIMGPMNIAICDDCVSVCNEILAEDAKKQQTDDAVDPVDGVVTK